MVDYTTEDVVRFFAVHGSRNATGMSEQEFNDWLASVRADAWDEGAKDQADIWGMAATPRRNPYRSEKQ